MGNVCFVFASFLEHDHTGICNLLESKARQGWMFEKEMLLGMKFRRMQPKNRKFQAVYLPQGESTAEMLERLKEFCVKDGWIYLTNLSGKYIFYNDSSDPVPIETDPIVQIENVDRCMQKQLRMYKVLMIVIGSSLIGKVFRLATNMDIFFWSTVLISISQALLVLMYALTIKEYSVWYKEALTAATEYGVFTPTKTKYSTLLAVLERLIAILILLCIAFLLLETIGAGTCLFDKHF